jgi:Holliday junction resolvase RusA-like endonuclease
MSETVTIGGRARKIVGGSRPRNDAAAPVIASSKKQPNKHNAQSAHRPVLTPLDGEAVRYGCLSLAMPPLSVNNLFANGGKGRFATNLYRQWQAQAMLQIRRQAPWHVPGRVRVRLKFTRAQTGADLDNLAKPVLDVLVKAGRMDDDRNVVELRMAFNDHATGTQIEIWTSAHTIDASLPKKGCAPPLSPWGSTDEAKHFRAQIPSSTDPAYLKRMAAAAERGAA